MPFFANLPDPARKVGIFIAQSSSCIWRNSGDLLTSLLSQSEWKIDPKLVCFFSGWCPQSVIE